jgi:hypothetical protein
MARAAVLGRLNWRAAQVVAVREESASARTLVLDVPGLLGTCLASMWTCG